MATVTEAVKERPILMSGPMVRAILSGKKTQTRRVVKFPSWFCAEGIPFSAPGYCDVRAVRASDILAHCTNRYGTEGDRLWVRETHLVYDDSTSARDRDAVWYRADLEGRHYGDMRTRLATTPKIDPADIKRDGSVEKCLGEFGWKPSIFMPRWASRITLEVASVRCERLQDIREADAIAEGLESQVGDGSGKAGAGFMWDGIGYHAGGFYQGRKSYHTPGRYGLCSCNVGFKTPAQCAFRELWDRINGKKHSWESNPWVWAVSFKVVR